jgi:sugar lactone lactonase YvrE
VFARGFGQPDDLAWGPHGSIYFSDFGNGAVNLLDTHGRRTIVYDGLRGPEGIVVLPDGSLIVAEQVPNRLLRIDPRRHTAHVVAMIPNPSARDGIDGIARDPRSGTLIVPDSPSGRVLRVDLAGHVRVLATGLGRPVGAYIRPDGRIVVVDETLNGAFLLGPHGTIQRLGGYLSVPDDVIGDGHGGLYISCLGDDTIRHLDPNGLATLVAGGLPDPQGLLRRADGTLIVAEESANLMMTVRP